MEKEIDFIVNKYSIYITDEIINTNTGGALTKFKQFKLKLSNCEFESEKEELVKEIQKGVIYFKNRILKHFDYSKKNNTFILENQPLFLEHLHFYIEYKKLIEPPQNTAITEQKTLYTRYTRDFYINEQTMSGKIKKLNLTEAGVLYENIQDFKFTYNKDIDNLIVNAILRNKNIFNLNQGNYRYESFTFIGTFEVFKINSQEYFIESNETEKGHFNILICNYTYGKKWLTYLDYVKGNYLFELPENIKEKNIENASKANINDFEKISEIIDKLYFHCIEYHHFKFLDNIDNISESIQYRTLGLLTSIWGWKQKKQRDYYEVQNELFLILQELFITLDPYDFYQVKEWILTSLSNYDVYFNKKGFQWGFSPFKDDIFSLSKKIDNQYDNKKIELKHNLLETNSNKKSTHKEISLIHKLAQIKAKELGEFKLVRYSIDGKNIITRVSFETIQIDHFFKEKSFNNNYKRIYLTALKDTIEKEKIKIQDNWASEAPDVTQEFLNWLDKTIINIDLENFTDNKNSPKNEIDHPSIFEQGSFKIFKKWIDLSKDDPIKKLSFIFQKLKSENKLRKNNFKDLLEWSKNNGFINDPDYSKLLIRGHWDTPKNILTKGRLELYNSIKSN